MIQIGHTQNLHLQNFCRLAVKASRIKSPFDFKIDDILYFKMQHALIRPNL